MQPSLEFNAALSPVASEGLVFRAADTRALLAASPPSPLKAPEPPGSLPQTKMDLNTTFTDGSKALAVFSPDNKAL